ncbi:MAG: DUF4837 family protein [Tannerellaceae bacterium]|jgi:hypothetical protein|nr:DUF4837 family protein [Tannerellaceae bacterium]
MRTQVVKLSLLVAAALAPLSCGGPLEKKATGMMYEVVVVMEQADWEGEVGEAIKADLYADVPGLPQSEATMKIMYASPGKFDGMLTYVRNILQVDIDPKKYTKVSLHAQKDVWADGQAVVRLNAPDAPSVVEYMRAHERILADYYTAMERRRLTAQLEKSYHQPLSRMIEDKFGVTLKVPTAFAAYKEDGQDFFWASDNASSGRTDVVIYTFPYESAETFTRDYLVAKRDSVMKINMPGAFPDSYMATETTYAEPAYKGITVNGKYCGELRGLWRMKGDMMGGPFVSHARVDEANNRIVVVEGFVYAPETDKKNYIRRIEAALYTLHLPGEDTELPEVEILP